jgi:DNA-binding CsgD family transcriptional regulator
MKLNNSRFDTLPAIPGHDGAEVKLNQLQAELVSTARLWAVNEIGAAMAHQLNEPLTAILLYLHGIKEHNGSGETTSGSTRQMLESAIHETERFSNIIQRMSHTLETKVKAELGIARSREAIASGIRSNGSEIYGSPVGTHAGQLLTPRERQVLQLITEGASNKEGGHRLQISTRTFEVHRAHIMGKLGARNAADLVRMALSEAFDG